MKTKKELLQEVKKQQQMLKGKPSLTYHFIWGIFSQILGITLLFTTCIYALGVVFGVLTAIVILGSGIFLIGSIFILFELLFSDLPRYLPIIAFPIYILMVIGQIFGESNDLSTWGYVYPLFISLALSAWGYMNIRIQKKAKKEWGEDSPILVGLYLFSAIVI